MFDANAIVAILGSILITVLSLGGYGAVAARLVGVPRPALGELAVLGALIAGSLTTAVHFAAPVHGWVQGLILGGGAFCAWLQRDVWKRAIWGIEAIYFLGAAAFLSYCAMAAKWPSYDTGLYHIQTVQWIREAAATPGLANIHGRLGFNSLYYELAALYSLPALGWKSAFSMTPVLAAGMLTGLYSWIVRSADDESGRLTAPGLLAFLATLVLGTAGALWFLDLSAMANDPLVTIAILLLAVQAWAALRDSQDDAALRMLLATGVLAVLVKLSAVLVVAPVLVVVAWRASGALWRARAALALGGAALALWCMDGLLLSGCLAYPVRATCITSLPWAIPESAVVAEARSIEWWAKWSRADQAPDGWTWVGPWWEKYQDDSLVYICAGLLAFSALAYAAGWLLGRRPTDADGPLLAAAMAVGAAGWFASAPDPRFGAGNLLGFFLILAAVAGSPWVASWKAFHVQIALLLGFLIALPAAPEPKPDIWGTPPQAQLQTVGTSKLGPVQRPVDGDRCWDAPIPCVPQPLSEKAIQLFSISQHP